MHPSVVGPGQPEHEHVGDRLAQIVAATAARARQPGPGSAPTGCSTYSICARFQTVQLTATSGTGTGTPCAAPSPVPDPAGAARRRAACFSPRRRSRPAGQPVPSLAGPPAFAGQPAVRLSALGAHRQRRVQAGGRAARSPRTAASSGRRAPAGRYTSAERRAGPDFGHDRPVPLRLAVHGTARTRRSPPASDSGGTTSPLRRSDGARRVPNSDSQQVADQARAGGTSASGHPPAAGRRGTACGSPIGAR